jgi:hypothetical protein
VVVVRHGQVAARAICCRHRGRHSVNRLVDGQSVLNAQAGILVKQGRLTLTGHFRYPRGTGWATRELNHAR